MTAAETLRRRRLRRTKAELVDELERMEDRLSAGGSDDGAGHSRAETEEARFRRAIEDLDEGLAIFDADDRLTFCNEAYLRVHTMIRDIIEPGVRFEDMVRAHAERGAVPDAEGRVEDYVRRRMKQHRDPTQPILRELADGTWFIITEGRTPDGGIYAITTDISLVKEAEAKLQRGQDQFIGAVAALQEGFALYDADDRLVLVNDEYRRLHPKVEDILKPGMRFEDLVRKNIERGVNADAVGRENEHIKDRMERHRNPKGIIVRTLTDGTKFLIRESRTPDGGVVVTETDITRQTRTEEAREKLSQAIENVPVGILLLDADDRLVFCNDRYREQMDVISDLLNPGVCFEDMVRAIVDRAPVKDARGRKEKYVRERMARHRNPSGPFDLRREDKWLQANEIPMDDGSTFVIVTDITVQKNAEEQLRQSEERMRGAIESLQEGFALFDADDRVVALNDEYRRINPMAQEILERGGTYEDMLRSNVERGVLVEAIGREEEFVRERMVIHRNPGKPVLRRMIDGRTFIVSEARTPEGGTALSFIEISDLRRTEDALRESEARLRAVFDNTPICLNLKDTEGRYLLINKPYEEWLGRPADEIIGKKPGEFLGDDAEVDAIAATERQVLETGQPLEREIKTTRHGSDETYDRFLIKFPIKADNGTITGIGTAAIDITGRVRAEEDLRRLALAIEGLSENFALYGADDRLIACNEGYRRLNAEIAAATTPGTTFEEHLRAMVEMGLAPDAEGREEEWIRDRLARHQNPGEPFELRRQDGIWLLVNDQRMPDGSIATVSTDITARKEAEVALRESEKRFRNLVQGSIQGVLIHRNHKPLFANHAYAQIFGYDDPHDILALDSVLELFPKDERARVTRYREARMRGDEAPVTYQLRGRREDGTLIWLENQVNVITWRGEPAIQTTTVDITERKQAEVALRESEQNYRILFENAAAGIGRSRLTDGKVLMANRKLADMFGYGDLDAFTEEFLFSEHYTAPEDRERMIAMYEENPDLVAEVSFTTRDGSIITVANQGWVDRRAGHVDFVMIDITALKTVETALRESEQRFRDVAESAGDWIWEMGPDLRFSYLSQRFFEISPVTPDQILGKTRDEFAAAPTDDHWRAHLDDLANHRSFRGFLYPVTLPDGHVRHIRISGKPVFDDDGTFQGYRGTGTDVTPEVEAAAAAEKAAADLSDAIESIAAGLALFDKDDRLTICNTRYRNLAPIVGAAAEPGTRFEDIVDKAIANDLYHPSMGPMDAFKKKRMEYHRKTPSSHEQHYADGRWLNVHEYGTHDGGTVLLWTDITERKLLERQLSGAQRMEALGKLTGGVAHDFNNLLTVILGNLQLLQRRIADQQNLHRYVELATGAAERGAQMTTRLLTFARRQKLDVAVTDINSLMTGMESLLQGTLGATIKLEHDLDAALWPVKTDAAQLENAILNLAINSKDAMPDGGRLGVKTANVTIDEHSATRLAAIIPGDYVTIAVSDTGAGMATDIVDHAFEPFFTTKELGKGTGLGLSTVYGFVKQSEGYVYAESEPGQGTVITLYLPRAGAPGVEADDDVLFAADATGGDENILVVEDDHDVRQTAVALLIELGYRVVEAEDGPSALRVLDGEDGFDLLFTDVVMPGGMKGPDLAQEARKRLPGLKVLYMSGYTEYGDWDGGQVALDAQLLNKPFKKSELADKIRHALDT